MNEELYFRPLETLEWKDGVYLKGEIYTVRPNNDSLFRQVKQWENRGKVDSSDGVNTFDQSQE